MAAWNILQQQYVYNTVCFHGIFWPLIFISFTLNEYLCKLVFTLLVCKNRTDEASNGKSKCMMLAIHMHRHLDVPVQCMCINLGYQLEYYNNKPEQTL